MSTPPLGVAQVLLEEYEHFHGALPRLFLKDAKALAGALHLASDRISVHVRGLLSDKARAELTNEWNHASPSERLRKELARELYRVLRDPDLCQGDAGRLRAALVASGWQPAPQLPDTNQLPEEILMSVNARLLNAIAPGAVGEIALKGKAPELSDLLRVIHHEGHSALCLSGGGIRSATFNLGILQGLARHGLLERFDYLSTVSGGGFVGGWLTAWIHRHPGGLKGVVGELKQPPARPLEPDPRPLSWLRTYSNYLSPRLGLLNADSWTLIAMVLRNLLLNWLVFVPWLVAALLLPRMWVAFFSRPTFGGWSQYLSLGVGLLTGVWFLTYIAFNLPSTHPAVGKDDGKGGGQRSYLLGHLLPLVVSAMSLATFWARNRAANPGGETPGGWDFALFAAAMAVVPWIITAYREVEHAKNKRRAGLLLVPATLAIGAGLLLTGYLSHTVAKAWPFGAPLEHPRLYACLVVPALTSLLLLGGTLLAGLTSNFNGLSDEDQEWWARSGAWMLIVMVSWAVFNALVLYGPELFTPLWKVDWNSRTWHWGEHWDEIGKGVGIVSGVVSGAITLFGGFSAKTPANEKEAQKAGGASKLLGVATGLLGPIFLGFIVAFLSFAVNWLLTRKDMWDSVEAWTGLGFNEVTKLAATAHGDIVGATPLSMLLLLLLLLAALGCAAGWLISTNRFSLHYMWRNRIVRGYLGASNERRAPNRFTGFDSADNLPMHKLRYSEPQRGEGGEGQPPEKKTKLFPVLNFALNLAGGSRLDWQNRKAESFTVSPLHCGSFQPADTRTARGALGYRPAEEYGGANGISLGTSVAISGAFVSPNMGYMMTSPVVRFLMTLFNVRFGWWLGNPKFNTYKYDRPSLSVIPITQEAFGLTDDTASYVYLSDGGHFENLGLYEMVMRRCRHIVVSDASTDDAYTFGSLGMAVRQIRVDLGVPIDFKKFSVSGAADGKGGVAYAVGRIRYSCVDEGAPDGTVIYLKPTLTGDEPRDVINYHSENPSFPQQVIVDQWFSEAQFESYRALGSYTVNELCGGDSGSDTDFQELRASVERRVRQAPARDLREEVREFIAEAIGANGGARP